MAITIRNTEVKELIRRIGARTGEGPSAVIRRLVQREATQAGATVPDEEVRRRIERVKHLRTLFPPVEPAASWPEIEGEMDSIFGDDLN